MIGQSPEKQRLCESARNNSRTRQEITSRYSLFADRSSLTADRFRSFTLTELLVVIGIIAILGALTVFSVGSIFKDAKMSGGVNTVMAALGNARALAMKENKITLVAFRSVLTGDNEMAVEAVIAAWTGELYTSDNTTGCPGFFRYRTDRYAPVPGAPIRRLPSGIKVAVPEFAADNDDVWLSQSHLPAINSSNFSGSEVGGLIVVVAYNGRGEVITTNSESDSTRSFVDFNDDFNLGGANTGQFSALDDTHYRYGSFDSGPPACHLRQLTDDDEPFVSFAPFIAVYDDDAARETYDTTQWIGTYGSAGDDQKTCDLTEYITAHAKRIHFNRYTGVVMK